MAISFVIPAYNEEQYIRACLLRIMACLAGKIDYEIIVVDNASTDDTFSIVSSIDKIRLIKLDTKVTISKARNTGWKKSIYDIVIFLDADVLITTEWAAELFLTLPKLKENPLTITGCRYALSEEPSKIERSWFENLKRGKESYINSGNLITTKNVLHKIDGFHESLITGEDVDFCERAQQKNIKIEINYKFLAHHEGYPKSISHFFRRERWHGTGDLKSFTYFIKSKVALFSFALTFIMILAIAMLSFGAIHIAISLFVVAAILNLLVVFYKFRYSDINTTIHLFFLNIIYAVARTASIFYRKKV